MSNSGNGGFISFIVWLILSIIIGAITDSVWIGLIGGTIGILAISYLLTRD